MELGVGRSNNQEQERREEEEERDEKGIVTIARMRKCLGEERPPTDDKEDIGNDKDAADYSLNSSFSDDDKEENMNGNNQRPTFTQEFLCSEPSKGAKTKGQADLNSEGEFSNLSLEGAEEVISSPYAEMPEFYPRQMSYDDIVGLPGFQRRQLAHRDKTVLRNHYWAKLLHNVFDIATADYPKTHHLMKMLSLYLLHHYQLRPKDESAEAIKPVLPSAKSTKFWAGGVATSRKLYMSSKLLDRKRSTDSCGSQKYPTRRSSINTSGLRHAHSSAGTAINCQHAETQKRLEKLEKSGQKLSFEQLARESKNLLVSLPPYQREDSTPHPLPERNAAFMRMLGSYAFSKGLLQQWQASV